MLNREKAKQISILNYLKRQGFEPIRTTGGEYYFNSPFRQERKPSFTVREKAGNDGEDLWFDFGLGNNDGGDIITLVMRLENCDFRTALKRLELKGEGVSTYQATKIAQRESSKDSELKLVKVQELNHYVLLKYLREKRHISEEIAKQYLKLIWYENKWRKNLFAFGWKNISDVYEIRGAGEQPFKAVLGKKDISLYLKKDAPKNCFIFEGILDYLSVLEMKNDTEMDGDVVVLNSTSLKNRILDLLEERQYQTIFTFFDNDKAGQEALQYLQTKTNHPDIRQQTFFDGFEDVNAWWQGQ